MAGENMKTYRGNCHCGSFVYEIELPEIKAYTGCNCSICHKKGYAWLFPSKLNVLKGSIDSLTAYTFNEGNFKHLFCPDCGTPLMCNNPKQPEGMQTGVNARALQDIDFWSLKANSYDGKAIPPAYKPAVYNGPEPSAEVENGKIYHGSCHCGAVTVALKVKPLETFDISKDEDKLAECNCSICLRNAAVWIYPKSTDHSVIQGDEHLTYYIFNTTVTRKAFCKHCGVQIYNEANRLTDEEIEALSDFGKAWRNRRPSFRNLSLRILDDFDCSTLKTRKFDGQAMITPGSYKKY